MTPRLFGQILGRIGRFCGAPDLIAARTRSEGAQSGSQVGGNVSKEVGRTKQNLGEGGSGRPGSPKRLLIAYSACGEWLFEGNAAHSAA